MSLKDYGNSTGGNYLKVALLRNGLRGSILRVPKMETKDFNDGKGPKLIVNFPMMVDGFNDGEVIWSPGRNAVKVLFEVLGTTDETRWPYPIDGSFEARNVTTKQGTRLAWCFVPDSGAEAPKGTPSGSSSTPSPRQANSTSAGAGRGTVPASSNRSMAGAPQGSQVEFVCSYTQKAGAHAGELCGRVYTDPAEFQKHVMGHR